MAHESLDELLQQTATLRRLALDLVGEAHADDVLQETAIQAMRSPPARSGSMMGWLTVVVRRLASKQRRADRVRRRHELEAVRSDVQPADRSIEDADSLRRLTEIVTTLPEPYRGTILARYLHDLSPSEIATERGEPVRTVKTRLQRGLGMLRERLDERTADWRPGLIAAFGLEPTTKVAVTAAGILLMNITTKFVLATAALLLAGVIAWQFVGREAPTVNERAQGPGPVAVAPPSLPEPIASGPPARVAVPVAPAVPSDPKVAVDGAVRSDEIGGIALLHVLGEHEDGQVRAGPAQRQSRLDPLVLEGGRQAHIEDAQLGIAESHPFGQFRGVRQGGDDGVPLVLQQPHDALA